MTTEPATRNIGPRDIDWYISIDQRIHEDPDWAYRWVAKRAEWEPALLKAQYAELVEDLRGHPDAVRGRALAWQLHDALWGLYAERAWLRRYPAKDGAFAQNEARRYHEHMVLEQRAARRSRAGAR